MTIRLGPQNLLALGVVVASLITQLKTKNKGCVSSPEPRHPCLQLQKCSRQREMAASPCLQGCLRVIVLQAFLRVLIIFPLFIPQDTKQVIHYLLDASSMFLHSWAKCPYAVMENISFHRWSLDGMKMGSLDTRSRTMIEWAILARDRQRWRHQTPPIEAWEALQQAQSRDTIITESTLCLLSLPRHAT